MCIIKRKKTVELSDVLAYNPSRTQTQFVQDAVMQLKNEIANSGAVKIDKMSDGNYKVSIKVVI